MNQPSLFIVKLKTNDSLIRAQALYWRPLSTVVIDPNVLVHQRLVFVEEADSIVVKAPIDFHTDKSDPSRLVNCCYVYIPQLAPSLFKSRRLQTIFEDHL